MSENPVSAFPSKSFFVSTLTRDIELRDAIMDLLDNCIDGILRLSKGSQTKGKKPYNQFWAKIELTSTSFSIMDNCGGIEKEVLEKSAFRLGRVDENIDKDLPTVGMYGIGMKRAIFKMGQAASVYSMHNRETYQVEIAPAWLKDDSDWNLPLTKVKSVMDKDGTVVEVKNLYENISTQFINQNFIDDLQKDIANFFAIIIEKGFTVSVNNKKVGPADFRLLNSDDFTSPGRIQPYVYQGDIDGVNVEIVVGFYRELPKNAEVDEAEDEERDIPSRKSENAGWTVICNDRVILYRDRTRMTGWGIRDIPKYHFQFIAIAGVVKIISNESSKLPLSTTKRNLDTNSNIYGIVLENMMDGIKLFTNFTNSWKGREKETAGEFAKMRRNEPEEIITKIPEASWVTVRGSGGKARKFVPELPKPSKDKEKRRIAFYKSTDEIALLAEYFYGDSKVLPSEVGERCFDEAIKSVKRG